MNLVHFDKARAELTLATKIDEVKNIRDKAEALRLYAKQSGESLEMQNQCAEIKIRAERKAGDILKETEKNPGGQIEHKSYQSHDVTSRIPTLSEIGITKSQASRWQQIAEIPEEDFEDHITETKKKKKELTSSGVRKLAKEKEKEKIIEAVKKQVLDEPVKPKLYFSDYLSWLKSQEEQCDLLLTDPPYMTDIDDIWGFTKWLPIGLAKVKPTGRAYICIGAYPDEIEAYLQAQKASNMILANILVWTYRNTLGPSPKYDYKLNWQAILYFRGIEAPELDCPLMIEQFSVQDINAPDGRRVGERYHTWQKPDELAERFIRHSTKPGDIVYDCFAGTGTFLLAATRLGRIGIGCDNDKEMLDIAKDRGCEIIQ